MLAEDLEDEPEDKYDEKEMVLVKQMIGLHIDRENDENESNDDERGNNLFSKSNKIYDFNTPSSKVFYNLPLVLAYYLFLWFFFKSFFL